LNPDQWLASLPERPAAPYDVQAREWWLAVLPTLLHHARTAEALRWAVDPPPGAGASLRAWNTQIRMPDASLRPADAPRVVVALDPPADARELAERWRIQRPVAVSGDVAQQMWAVQVGGDDFPVGERTHVEVAPVWFGRWRLTLTLTARPSFDPGSRYVGPAPAYEIAETGGEIATIEIEPSD
jgi:hypothetical protein